MDVVVMPQLGETVVEGTITRWSKAVGDPVAVDDTLFEVSTEKVDTEVPSAVAGYLRAVLVDEGDAVPIGTPVAIITAAADEPFEAPAAGTQPTTGSSPQPANADAGPPDERRGPARSNDTSSNGSNGSSSTGHRSGVVLSPVVRRLLDEHGIEPQQVVGSGRDGRITRNDVVAAAAQAGRAHTGARSPVGQTDAAEPAAPPIEIGPDDEVVPLSRARLATAANLARSAATVAHALVVVEVDWSSVEPVRRAAGLSYLPFVARAVVDALRSFPHLNASFDTDQLVVHRRVHLGVAVDVEHQALLVPVVHDAHELRLGALADAVAEIADQARRRRLPGHAFDGGTFTLTNVGSYGTVLAAPIINQPQVAILSTDGVAMRPVAVADGEPSETGERRWAMAVRPVGNLSLSFDHRAVDGAYAAGFLAEVRSILEHRDWAVEVAP